MQAVLDVHDTPFSSPCAPLPGFAVPWIAHREPFQPSASGLSNRGTASFEPSLPTATHAFAEAHDTSLNPDVGTRRLGVPWIDHLVPFQRSTTGTVSFERSSRESPTAVHAVADEQDTPQSQSPSPEFSGVGVRRTDHLVPSQCAAPDPTATQAVADAHDTSLPPGAPRWSDQLDPFHRPTDELPPKNEPRPSVYGPPPTAMQNVLDVHDTPVALKPFGIC